MPYGLHTRLKILVYWSLYNIGLHAGSKVFGIHLLINGPNPQLFVSMNWDGPHSKHIMIIYLFGLCIPSSIREQPLISLKYYQFNTLSTRSHSLTLNLVCSTINAFRHSFFVTVPFLWNFLPPTILSQPTAGSFKHKLKHFLFCK